MEQRKRRKSIGIVFYILISAFSLAACAWFVEPFRLVNALWLSIVAVGGYFFITFFVTSRNWMDVRGVFHAVWIFTIMLATLRLLAYQEVWQKKTWICLAGAYAVFQLGANLGLVFGNRAAPGIRIFCKKLKFSRVSFQLQENRLFWICLFTTFIGFVCFVINVKIRGYIPCFSSDPSAYVNFYTRFYVFSVASTSASGLCYYCIKTQKISLGKKVILGLCILYLTFLFPILVVSRGTFVVSAVSLTVVVFYLHRKKLWVLVLCVVIIAAVYAFTTVLRGYTDSQLNDFFSPVTIQVDSAQLAENPFTVDINSEPYVSENTEMESNQFVRFKLPPKLSFVYCYLTVSHDNFNEAVENSVEYAKGVCQLTPFNVILRNGKIREALSNRERYLVRPFLNTTNLIGDFYYDFHEWGVFVILFLWAFVFGAMQQFYMAYQGPFSLLTLGNAMVPIALCFFSTWLSTFSQWLLWGTILLMAIAATFKIQKQRK